ncbi:hypothetical protein CON18_14780 [Bacillus cereus]|uniref:hypothetical protein n=1 Tax=Bacillus cereus TaxID=1396 RepID=UPI000BECBA1A|nr:hypothetical protein [Bacillus cereus]PDZ39443.1 hypothetical protein CON18_14780 [Bacillus cereus]PGN74812.1 hypothetical protein CN963_28805 [Bacillus cereus]
MNFYSIAQGLYNDRNDYYLFHEEKFNQEEFIKKYNFAIEQLTKKTDPRENIDAEQVISMMCELYQFKRVSELYKIHCHEEMKKVDNSKPIDSLGYIEVE